MYKQDTLPCSTSIEINYINSKKETSTRIVDVNIFSKDANQGYFRGYCHMRNMTRAFNYRNVTSCVDVLTGEIVNVSSLFSYFNAIYEQAPERELDFFLSSHKHIIDVLVYIGKIDGRFIALEKKEILSWILSTSFLSSSFLPYAEKLVSKWSAPVDDYDYLNSLRMCKRYHSDMLDEIYQHAVNVVTADNKILSEEIMAIEMMKKIFDLEKD